MLPSVKTMASFGTSRQRIGPAVPERLIVPWNQDRPDGGDAEASGQILEDRQTARGEPGATVHDLELAAEPLRGAVALRLRQRTSGGRSYIGHAEGARGGAVNRAIGFRRRVQVCHSDPMPMCWPGSGTGTTVYGPGRNADAGLSSAVIVGRS